MDYSYNKLPTSTLLEKTKNKKINFKNDTSSKILDFIDNTEKYKANINDIYFLGLTPFWLCWKYQPKEVVLKMIDKFNAEELNLKHQNYNVFLDCLKVNYQPIEVIIKMIEKFSANDLFVGKKSCVNSFGQTAFLICCIYQHDEVVLKMIDKFNAKELNINSIFNKKSFKNENLELTSYHNFHFYLHFRWTPFKYCCRFRSSDIVIKMIDNFKGEELGINYIKMTPNVKFSPLMFCCKYQSQNVILKMINKFSSKDLNLRAINHHNQTAFIICCQYQPEQLIIEMIEKFSAFELNINYTWAINPYYDLNIKSNVFQLCSEYVSKKVLIKMIEKFSEDDLNINYKKKEILTNHIF